MRRLGFAPRLGRLLRLERRRGGGGPQAARRPNRDRRGRESPDNSRTQSLSRTSPTRCARGTGPRNCVERRSRRFDAADAVRRGSGHRGWTDLVWSERLMDGADGCAARARGRASAGRRTCAGRRGCAGCDSRGRRQETAPGASREKRRGAAERGGRWLRNALREERTEGDARRETVRDGGKREWTVRRRYDTA